MKETSMNEPRLVISHNGGEKNAAQSIDTHDRVTEAYFGKLGLPFMRETQRRIHWICANVHGKRILDVGCSQGIVAFLLGREGRQIVGIDSDPRSIEEASDHLAAEAEHVQGNVSFVVADYLTHDFGKVRFDTIVLAEVLEHLVLPENFIEKSLSLLNPGGRMVVTVPFGINDFIDHKATFYLLEPYRLLARYCELTEVKLLGKWLGLVGTKRDAPLRDKTLTSLDFDMVTRLEDAFHLIERELRDDLDKTRSLLGEANGKYRTATEQVANLRQRVSQEESERKNKELAVIDLQAKLASTEEAYKEHLCSSQQPQLALEEKVRSSHAIATEAQQLAARLQSERDNLRERLDDANAKYRQSTEQYAALKQRLSTAETSQTASDALLGKLRTDLANAEQHLATLQAEHAQRVAQLTQELAAERLAAFEAQKDVIHGEAQTESLRVRLEEVLAQVKTAEQEAVSLQHRLAEQETARQAGLVSVAHLQSQVAHAEKTIEEERRRRHEEVERLQAELANYQDRVDKLSEQRFDHQTAIHEAEKNYWILQAERDALRLRLEEANAKYRQSTEHYADLKQSWSAAQASLAASEASVGELMSQLSANVEHADRQRSELEHELAHLRADLARKREDLARLENDLSNRQKDLLNSQDVIGRIEAERNNLLQRLEEDQRNYMLVAEQARGRQDEIVRAQAAFAAADDECQALKTRIAEIVRQSDKENAEQREEVARLQDLLEKRLDDISRLSEQIDNQQASLEQSQDALRRMHLEHDSVLQRLEEVSSDCQRANERANAQQAELAKLQVSLADAEKEDWDLRAQISASEQRADEERVQLERECQALRARIVTVEQQSDEARAEQLKEVVRLEDLLQQRLDDISRLSEQIDGQRAALEQSQDALRRMKLEHDSVLQRLEAVSTDGQRANEQAEAQQAELATLRVRLAAAEKEDSDLRAQLSASEQRATEERVQLEQELARMSAALNGKLEEVARIEEQILLQRAARSAAEDELRRADNERQALTNQVDQLHRLAAKAHSELESTADRLADEQARHEAALGDLSVLTDQFDEIESKYRLATAQTATLSEQLLHEENARRLIENTSAELKEQLREASAAHEETQRHLAKTSSEVQTLKALRRDQEHALEQLRLQALKAAQRLRDSESLAEQLRQQKIAAEYQVVKTRATLSFQLGYLLIHGFKSLGAFRDLPRALWELNKEAGRRRAAKRQQIAKLPAGAAFRERASTLLPGLPPSARAISSGKVADLKRLKVACVMDEFTFTSYEPECNLLQLSPLHWQTELESFQPEMLFIESAWRGKDDLWGSKVGHASQELQSIVNWCRKRRTPTVFWNKEDPIHFETFLNTAKLFDYVFTTDIDCIHRYKAALGHANVYLLPFAAQPSLSNPMEVYERKDAFCFAGAYYVRYPERTRDLGNFVSDLSEFRPVEIYDRNFGKHDPNYQFPPEYEPFIVGNLPFDQIDRAYKGYRYAINLNSIKQSQSMFARRVFELLASNTVTVSNFSRGVRLLFGDLVITTDSGQEIVRRLGTLGGDEVQMRKHRLAALRKVMSEHTYLDRLTYVVSKVQSKNFSTLLPPVAIGVYVKSQEHFDALYQNYARQDYEQKNLFVVVTGGVTLSHLPDDQRVRIWPAPQVQDESIASLLEGIEWIAGMVPDDYYGPNYLLDLVLATRYSDATAIGKLSHYVWSGTSGLSLKADGWQYHSVSSLPARAALVKIQNLGSLSLREWVISLYKRQLETESFAGPLLSIDEFNYCRDGGAAGFAGTHEVAVNDLVDLDTGIGIRELLDRAERIPPEEAGHDQVPVWPGSRLAALFNTPGSKKVRLEVRGAHWYVESDLADGQHEYLYAPTELRPEDLGFDRQIRCYFDVAPGVNVQLVLLFLDAKKQRISSAIKMANRNQEADVPAGTVWIRLGLRVYASGAADIRALVLGHRTMQPGDIVGVSADLVLSNHYPSYDDLYRNAFVHSRVVAYRKRGVRPDVFRLRPAEALSYHEFENVDVITGSQEALHRLLVGGRYRSVLVHFLDQAMWQVLRQHIDRMQVLVWVHGAEIQPWHRRSFNYQTEQERNSARSQSETRIHFWKEVLSDMPTNLRLVFVSNYLAATVMEDLGLSLPEGNFSILPNPIDTKLFTYQEKAVEQRRKILSIRPYASPTYANDLSVKAILALSSKPYFKDLEFRMIGDGKLFDQTLEPLRDFNNVYIERRFLTQTEIAILHKEYGIFLCPTRMDTQGVSRDEAMSSGLVPITNAVAAVPEFVDGSCGILAREENAEDLAAGIAAVYEDPQNFLNMSRAAAARVRAQRSVDMVIDHELLLLRH